MKPEHNPTLPASARAVTLVRQHHGLPSTPGLEGFQEAGNWSKLARRHHLRAQRRIVKLEEIPESRYPVILELHGGSRLVILTEKRDESTYGVQFPDAREADVSAERLAEVYDGRCIFLKPGPATDDGGAGKFGGMRRSFREFFGSVKLSKGAFGFNLVVLLLALLLIYSNDRALGDLVHRSLVLPLLATGIAACALAGVIGLRHELFRYRVAGGWMDLAFVPVLFAAAVAAGGWAVVPLVGFGALLVGHLLCSKRVGSVPSRLQCHWKAVVTTGFVIGAFSLTFAYLGGALNVAMMNGALGLSCYALYLIAHGGSSWQAMRLAMCR